MELDKNGGQKMNTIANISRSDKAERPAKLWRILPGLAWKGVMNNGTVYFPYFGAGIFSVFTYFIFSSILHNDIISILPRSGYAWAMLELGRWLLGVILLPFLFYANSFLMKRRKKEIGLYSILGLEKKHIGFSFAMESVLTYGVALAAGMVSGIILAKFLFLVLLRMTGLPVNLEFVFEPGAFRETAVFFFWVYLVNLLYNLIQVGRAKPVELLSGGKKGEKEPRFLALYAALGVVTLGKGYWISIQSRLDSDIFLDFFFAVFLVIVGTYLIFTSGSIALLKLLKKRKGFYYKASNFITVSGMLNRMKKNAASLVNICIFSTMVIITLVCTSSLYLGLDGILHFSHPYDMDVYFMEGSFSKEDVEEKLHSLEGEYGLPAQWEDYTRIALDCGKTGNHFGMKFQESPGRADNYRVSILLEEDYNRMADTQAALGEGEVLVYSQGADFGYGELFFMDRRLTVKEELADMDILPKAGKNGLITEYALIVRDEETRVGLVERWLEEGKIEENQGFLDDRREHAYRLNVAGGAKDMGQTEAFVRAFRSWCQTQPGYVSFYDNIASRKEYREMMGGLLFLGLLFSLIFLMCLLLIMYYKQISEGFDDKEGFTVMRKVGMDDGEIKRTVHKQILLVFYLPLLGAVSHTFAGVFMIEKLFGAICFYNTKLLVCCALGMLLVFAALYGVSYLYTARTYYRIVSGDGR